MIITSPGKVAISSLLGLSLALSNCTSFPTLVEVSRVRHNQNYAAARDIRFQYTVTDLDVLNFTNGVKRHLDKRSSIHTNVRYGSATTMATLGGLAGAAKTLGWSTGTASMLGLGGTFIFGLGQIFNSKGHAQAYEQSLAAVQAAEARFLFYSLKGRFKNGKVDKEHWPQPTAGIPSSTQLTFEGEMLYYRVTKILNVLYDSLAGKIPDLQDLKEAHGEGDGTGGNAGQPPPSPGDPSPPTNPDKPLPPDKIPAHLKPQNERLENAFKNMDEAAMAEKLKVEGFGNPDKLTVKQYLAQLILAEVNLPVVDAAGHPLPEALPVEDKKNAYIPSLTYYRSNAADSLFIEKMEKAYRTYFLLP